MRVVVSDSQLQNGVNCKMKIKSIFSASGGITISQNILQYRIEGDENLYTIGYDGSVTIADYSESFTKAGFLDIDLEVIYAKSLTNYGYLFFEIEIDEKYLNIFVSQLTSPNLILSGSNYMGMILSLLYSIAKGGLGFPNLSNIKNAQQINIPANTRVNITLGTWTRYVYMFDTSIGSFSGIGALRLIYNNVEIPINPNILYPLGQGATISVVNTSNTTQYTLIIFEF